MHYRLFDISDHANKNIKIIDENIDEYKNISTKKNPSTSQDVTQDLAKDLKNEGEYLKQKGMIKIKSKARLVLSTLSF